MKLKPETQIESKLMRMFAVRTAGDEGWQIKDTSATRAGLRRKLPRWSADPIDMRLIFRGQCSGEEDEDDGWIWYRTPRPENHGWTWDEWRGCWRAPEENVASFPEKPIVVKAIDVAVDRRADSFRVRMSAGGQTGSFKANNQSVRFEDAVRRWMVDISRGADGRLISGSNGDYLELFAFPGRKPNRVRIVTAIIDPWLTVETLDHRTIGLNVEVGRTAFVRALGIALAV